MASNTAKQWFAASSWRERAARICTQKASSCAKFCVGPVLFSSNRSGPEGGRTETNGDVGSSEGMDAIEGAGEVGGGAWDSDKTHLTQRMGCKSIPTPSNTSDRLSAAKTTKSGSIYRQNPRTRPRLWYSSIPGVKNNGDELPKLTVEPNTTPPNRVGSRSTAEYSA